jgi:hypothetical protein
MIESGITSLLEILEWEAVQLARDITRREK